MQQPDTKQYGKSINYFISRTGRDSFWARIINRLQHNFYHAPEGTLSVSLSEDYRYNLNVNLTYFNKAALNVRYLDLVHEAAHVALLHIPRYIKLVTPIADLFVRRAVTSVANWAMDFTINDSILRVLPDFKTAHMPLVDYKKLYPKGHFDLMKADRIESDYYLLPEDFGLPKGQTFERYVSLMLTELPNMKNSLQQMLNELEQDLDAADARDAASGAGTGDGDKGPSGEGSAGEGEAGGSEGEGDEGSESGDQSGDEGAGEEERQNKGSGDSRKRGARGTGQGQGKPTGKSRQGRGRGGSSGAGDPDDDSSEAAAASTRQLNAPVPGLSLIHI